MAPTIQRPSTRTEIVIGRALAMCVHPSAAWRAQSARGRAFLVVAYAAVSYAAILGLLLTGSPRF